MNPKYLSPFAVFIAIAILLAFGLGRNPKLLPSTLIDQPVPAFQLTNVAPTAGNDAFSTEQLLGQKWVLNVWASWCVSCRIEHPLFNQLATLNIAPVVGLNYKDEPEAARQWLADRGNPYIATPADQLGRVGIDWGVVAVPETFIIDEQGKLIYKHTGPIDAQILNAIIIPILENDLKNNA